MIRDGIIQDDTRALMHHMKVSQYSNESLCKSVRGLNILYDHYVTGSDKMISLSINSKLLPYCTRVFVQQKYHFKTSSITETFCLSIHNETWIIILMHQYLAYSVNTHI